MAPPIPSTAPSPVPSPASSPVPSPVPSPRTSRVERRSATDRDRRNGGSAPLGRTTFRNRRLGARLDREVGPIGAVVHGCRVEGATYRIDHLVVAPNGVWTVVADHAPGRLRIRRRSDADSIMVDRTSLADRVTSSAFAAERVRAAIGPLGFDWLDVHPVLCLTNARRGLRRESMLDGVLVTTPRALTRHVVAPGALLCRDAVEIARELEVCLVRVADAQGRRS